MHINMLIHNTIYVLHYIGIDIHIYIYLYTPECTYRIQYTQIALYRELGYADYIYINIHHHTHTPSPHLVFKCSHGEVQ